MSDLNLWAKKSDDFAHISKPNQSEVYCGKYRNFLGNNYAEGLPICPFCEAVQKLTEDYIVVHDGSDKVGQLLHEMFWPRTITFNHGQFTILTTEKQADLDKLDAKLVELQLNVDIS